MMHSFKVRAAIDPQAIPRVIGHLARQWATPVKLLAEQVGDELMISFTTCDLTTSTAELVGATLRSCVLVREVDLQANGRTHARSATENQ